MTVGYICNMGQWDKFSVQVLQPKPYRGLPPYSMGEQREGPTAAPHLTTPMFISPSSEGQRYKNSFLWLEDKQYEKPKI